MKKTKAIADHYGKEHQTIKAMEELAELIQALAKGDIENIKEEIADVRVMLEQIEYLYGISDDAITLRMCAKLWRQLERMEGESQLPTTKVAGLRPQERKSKKGEKND